MKEKIVELFNKLISGRKMVSLLKGFFFFTAASILGIFLALKIFFPSEYILAEINKELFVKDMGLEAENVSYSPLATISFEMGKLTEKGETKLLFDEISFSPSIISLISKKIGGELDAYGFNNQGGELALDIDAGEEPCYQLAVDELPLSLIKIIFPGLKIRGFLTGESDVCKNKKRKFNGKIGLKGKGLSFAGNISIVPIERLNLGELEFDAEIKNNRLEINKMTIKGDLDIMVQGKISINPANPKFSRTDLTIELTEAKKGVLKKSLKDNYALFEGMMNTYKARDIDGYRIGIRGSLTNPSVRKARKYRKSSRRNRTRGNRAKAQRDKRRNRRNIDVKDRGEEE